MELMRDTPDKWFDLAIVDPPYGISAPKMGMGAGYSDGNYYASGRKNRLSAGAGKLKDRKLQTMSSEWDARPPTIEYFLELRRVSRAQIIWGGNYFPLPPTRCIVCWDKRQPWENFSQWEMAWTSFDQPAALFQWQNGSNEPGKIHPTQKPIALYSWLLSRYAKPGQRILDTHLGSGSHAIACHYFGAHLTATEIDADYYAAACGRIKRETAQEMLPMAAAEPEHVTADMFGAE
jgi:site-specific DNA-methyltransferase (adenine-specific)